MAFPNSDNLLSLQSDGVAAIGPYIAVVKNAAGAIGIPGASTVDIVGVAQQGVAILDTTTDVAVAVAGVSFATAGAVIPASAGAQPLMADATGRFIVFVAGAGNAHTANLQPDANFVATIANDRIKIQILHNPLLT